MELTDKMQALVSGLETYSNMFDANDDKMVLADLLALEEDKPEIRELVAKCYAEVSKTFKDTEDKVKSILENLEKKSSLSVASLERLAEIATNLDEIGLHKDASVLDEILLTIGANYKEVQTAKRAQDSEIEKIRAKQKIMPEFDPYQKVHLEHDKDNQVEEARKLIADAVKSYRPLQQGLSTRTCPDHPGAQMSRVGDNTYQCSLDKGIYNYNAGYTTMKGNQVPGGDVSNQTQSFSDQSNESTTFDSRENRLNRI